MQTAKEFEMQINQAESDKEVRLNGKVYWEVKTGNTFTIGRNCMKGVISISRSGVVIDGSNAEIEDVYKRQKERICRYTVYGRKAAGGTYLQCFEAQ